MASFLLSQIVNTYNLHNNQKTDTQTIKKIASEQKIEERDLLKLLEVSTLATYKCLNNEECNFYIKIYSEEELEEIKTKIQNELSRFPQINWSMIELIKQKYHIGDRDMRTILHATYINYKKAEQENDYLPIKLKKQNTKAEKEIINYWKVKDSITYKSIIRIQTQYQLSLEEIQKILKIPQKEFKKLLNRQIKKVKIDLYSEEEKQNYKNKIKNQKKYRVSKKAIEKFAKTEKISINKVGQVLGINQTRFKNLMQEKQLTIKAIDKKLKTKVEKIELDLKYMPNYGERYYKRAELELISVLYGVPLEEMMFYLAKRKTTYIAYEEALQHNPNGVWLGSKMRLSNEFVEENYDTLNYFIEQMAKEVCYRYKCPDLKDDFKSEVYEYLLKNGGTYEKNLYHNPELLITCLVKNAKFLMIAYFAKMPRELSLDIQYNGEEFENERILADERYNPEVRYLEEKHSYLVGVEEVHKDIVRDIFHNNYFAIDYPKQCFAKIADCYHMNMEMFEERMGEIRALFQKNGLIKFDKQGRVISMLDA